MPDPIPSAARGSIVHHALHRAAIGSGNDAGYRVLGTDPKGAFEDRRPGSLGLIADLEPPSVSVLGGVDRSPLGGHLHLCDPAPAARIRGLEARRTARSRAVDAPLVRVARGVSDSLGAHDEGLDGQRIVAASMGLCGEHLHTPLPVVVHDLHFVAMGRACYPLDRGTTRCRESERERERGTFHGSSARVRVPRATVRPAT